MGASTKWSKKDEEYLRDAWGNMNIITIMNNLNRTGTAIRQKAKRLGLGGATINSSKYITAYKASAILNCHKKKILKWIHRKELKATYMALSPTQKVWCINFDKFIDFLKNNQDKWDSTKLEKHSLGFEPQWLVEKRKRDRLKSPVMNLYKVDDEKKIWELIEKDYTYKQIAKELDRTERGISMKVRKMYRQKLCNKRNN